MNMKKTARQKRGDGALSHSQRDFGALYAEKHTLYQHFATRVASLIEQLLKKRSVSTYVIEHRAKSVESFREKIQRPGKAYTNPLDEITDLAGCRVILHYQEDVAIVSDLLRSEFVVDETRSGGMLEELSTDQFGYRSIHLILALNGIRLALPEWSAFRGMVAEVQIRTVLQHAWAAVSHSLQYKRESDVPSILRRRLNRLSGLFELADDEFSALRKQQGQLIQHISEQFEVDDLSTEMNSNSVLQYVEQSKVVENILSEVFATPGLKVESGESVDDLVGVGELLGLRTISDLNARLTAAADTAGSFFEHFAGLSPCHNNPEFFVSGDADHWCAALLAGQAHSIVTAMQLHSKLGWYDQYCDRVRVAGMRAFASVSM